MKKRLGARKTAPHKAKKAAKPTKAAKKAKVAKKAASKRATAKRASRASRPAVKKAMNMPAVKPAPKKEEARVETKAPPVEKRPFWSFLGFGRKQKAKVSLMELQGKK